jgi:polyferredoxin
MATLKKLKRRNRLVQYLAALAINFNIFGIIGRIFDRIGKTPPPWLASIITGSNNLVETATKSVCVPGLNCYSCPAAGGACPMGAIQHFIAIKQIPWFAAGSMLAITTIFGRMPCGWLCPFGLIQDLLYGIKTPKFKVGFWSYYLKYVSLVGIAGILVFVTGETWFCKLCPAGALEAGIPQILLDPSLTRLLGTLFIIKLIILGATLILSVFMKRPFCRVCALGAVFSLGNRFSFLTLHVDKEACTKCDACVPICPMGIKPYEHAQTSACIRCLRCTFCQHITFTNQLKIPSLKSRIKEARS